MNIKKMGPFLNKSARLANQKRVLWISLAAITALVVILGFFYVHKHSANPGKVSVEKPQFVPFNSISEFDKQATGTALSDLQTSQSITQDRIKDLNDQNSHISKSYDSLKEQIANLQKEVQQLSKQNSGQPSSVQSNLSQSQPSSPQVRVMAPGSNINALQGPQPLSSPSGMSTGVSDFSFSYQNSDNSSTQVDCTPDNCVLPGTFARAVLLGAADANASVTGESNTTPILFRILDDGTLPNGGKSHLLGCVVVGEVYGDISSERGEVKLVQISCIKKGQTITKPINGTAYDISGKEGIRGFPVMRNGKILGLSALSGFAAGVGNAVQNQYTTQSTSALGTTTTTNPGNIMQAGAANGASTALDKLASYYIKLAEQYHPLIEINAGAQVDLVFLNQFMLTHDKGQTSTPTSTQGSNKNAFGGSSQNIRNLNYGDQVSPYNVNQIQQQIQGLGGQP